MEVAGLVAVVVTVSVLIERSRAVNAGFVSFGLFVVAPRGFRLMRSLAKHELRHYRRFGREP